MKKLHKRYFTFVFASLMSFFMSGIISFTIVCYEFGFADGLFVKFLSAWQFSLPFAFIIAQLIAPCVRIVTLKIVEM
jgi:hypothetical protein